MPKQHSLLVGDGGYLSWIFGSAAQRWDAWQARRFIGWVIAMDSSTNIRMSVDPGYKQKRADKRAADPSKQAVKERVEAFKLAMYTDPRLCRLELHGLEADDVIGLLSWRYPGLRVIGGDKDLLQLQRWFSAFKHIDDTNVTIAHFQARLPVACQRLAITPATFPLVLALLGDKSDSVKRLIPPYRLDIFVRLFTAPNPWEASFDEYGTDFLRNLMLVALPYPGVFNIGMDELFMRMEAGAYTPEQMMPYLQPHIAEALEAVPREAERLRELHATDDWEATLPTEERKMFARMAERLG